MSHKNSVLKNINLTIDKGAFVLICGPSGCGKTTLLRLLKPSISPHGEKVGSIYLEGTPLEKLSLRDATAKIGFVLQSPENQIVTDKVWHELAFGLESLGLSTSEIRLRVAEMASFFGIQTWFHKSVVELSGGQKQLLALASVMAMQPSVLILDEPTSQLDPIAASDFLSVLNKINRELGVTVILTEHRLEEAFPLASQVCVMDQGAIVSEGTPYDVDFSKIFLALPTPMRVWAACADMACVDTNNNCPITVREGAEWLSTQAHITNNNEPSTQTHIIADINQLPAITLDDIWFRYENNLPDVVKGVSFKVYYGEITAILGGNGTGKTTTLSIIAGLHKPYRGKIHTDTTVYMLPQNPQSLFIAKTLHEDLLEMLSEFSISKEEKSGRINTIIKLCCLEGLMDNHPYDLSGGEQQRAALAKVLLLQPKILLLDEPTKGLDAEYKQEFATILRKLATEGVAIMMVSHDIEFCAEYVDRCALFFDGDIVTENTTGEFFKGNSFYTTGANRMARHILPEAITATDIIKALGGKVPPKPKAPDIEKLYEITSAPSAPSWKRQKVPMQRRKLSKRTLAATAIILLTIPATIYAGIYFFDDRQFYFISMLIILQTMLPFAIIFESRKPKARELVIIAVLCAIAVAGRGAFFMVPQFKPIAAIVIIAGVAFGGEAGFLVGAKTAFISNMFFGQGPWTPWQMFAFGLIGFLAGILFHKGLLRRSPLPLAVFGGFATFIIYGGILNPANVLMFQPNPTIEMLLLSYLYGIPFDLIHAAATVIFLALISRPMLEKLDRIKIKYGLVE